MSRQETPLPHLAPSVRVGDTVQFTPKNSVVARRGTVVELTESSRVVVLGYPEIADPKTYSISTWHVQYVIERTDAHGGERRVSRVAEPGDRIVFVCPRSTKTYRGIVGRVNGQQLDVVGWHERRSKVYTPYASEIQCVWREGRLLVSAPTVELPQDEIALRAAKELAARMRG